ncbi:MAG TPA: AMP-binding protein [Acidimicrobiales bacterium]
MNLASVIEAHPAEAEALVDEAGRVVTYGELRDDVARRRGGLTGLGLRPGDRVALALPTGPDFVATYLAVLGTGAVAVPLNPHSPTPELQRELTATTPRVLVAGPDAATAELDVEHLVPVGDLRAGEPAPGADTVGAADDDVAVLVFTSGTAGPSRPAMLTHGNLRANIDQLFESGGRQTPDDRVLAVLPSFHIYGLNVAIGASLAAGSTVVLAERFDPAGTLALVTGQGVTIVPGVPSMWSAWAALPEADAAADAFAKVRLATSGAAPFDPAVRAAVRDRFGLDVVEGYGLTEASPAVTSGFGLATPDGSIGVPLPGVQVRLVDRVGPGVSGDGPDPGEVEDVLVGDPGEIWVRGPNVFPGYWEDPAATAAALTPDGWLRTGDVAVVDDDGFLYLVDRAKDLVIVSGFNVFPAEVEDVLTHHPGVAEAAVVGRPDPQTGEAVTAYVVAADPERPPTGRELIDHCRDHLAGYKCPVEVAFVAELPHSLNGKLLRRAL